MKKNIIPAVFLLVGLCSSCRAPKFLPVESVRIEYREKLSTDSVFRLDSVFIKQTADTVFLERYKFLYKYKTLYDSIFRVDTIRQPYPVEVAVKVKAPLTEWQSVQIWCGRAAIFVLLLVIIYFARKLF